MFKTKHSRILKRLFAPSASHVLQLPRLIVAGASVGIITIGFLIAAIGGLPFYQSLKDIQNEHFIFEVAAVANSMEQYLVQITEIATQITSRTKAREKLQDYNAGLVDLNELHEFSSPILTDAMNLKTSLIGITRFDNSYRPVVTVGTTPPTELLSIDTSKATQTRLLGPLELPDQSAIVVIAPIKDRLNNVVGIDAITFDFAEILVILQDFSNANLDKGIYLSRKIDNQVQILFQAAARNEKVNSTTDRTGFVEFAFNDKQFNQVSLASSDSSSATGEAIGYYLFDDLGWLLSLQSNERVLYQPIYWILTKYFALLIAVIGIGGLGIFRLLQPLADRVISLTENLHSEIAERKLAEQALAKRITQQETVAEFGQFCLSSFGVQTLFDHAVKVTADTLHVEFCKVLELIPEHNVMKLRSGVGWQDGLVGVAEIDLSEETQASYTLASKEPVAVESLETEARFSGPQLLIEHNIQSGISVIIDPTNPWGVFGAHCTRKRVFTKDDTNFVQAIANCLAEAIERRKAEDASKSAEERFRALYHENPAVFLTIDADSRIGSINQYGAVQLGYRAEEIIGEPVDLICHSEDRELLQQNLRKCLSYPRVIHRWELRKTHRNGSFIWAKETARVVTDRNGDKNILIVCEDISEARSLSEKLSFEASHDPLTGLFNRREFESRLSDLVESTRDDSVEHILCYLDLDQFKVINDTCGHVAGDQLLCQLAALVKNSLRKADTVARLGGDEFGLLLENCSVEQAEAIANNLRKRCEEYRFSWEQRSFRVGISVGLVPVTQTSGSITDLLRNADTACYAAKDAGRNRVHVYQENDADAAKRHGEMLWVSRINEALEENRFRLFAQKIEPIQPELIGRTHHELLIRLEDRDKTIILPGAFLPAAERYNLAVRIDKWVVKTLFDYLNNYPGLLAELGICSVNISGQSLADSHFLTYVIGILQENEIAADQICFEITETAAIANLNSALLFMNELRQMGCHFALDDFGSGFSSFAYLKTLPVDYLKIDGIFVKDITSDPADFAMVNSIHAIGKSLGKTTVAEFVEDEETKNAVTMIGVDYAQGYGIGHPVPLDELSSVAANVDALTNKTISRQKL